MEIQELLELLSKEKDDNLTELERQKLEDWYNSLNAETTAFKDDDPNNLELSEQMLLEFRQKWLKPTFRIPYQELFCFRNPCRAFAESSDM